MMVEEDMQTVFVVEDDQDAREAISALLSPSGIEVRAYATAEDFLSGYNQTGDECLLLDERLPGMTGSELLQQMCERGVDLPTIVVTGFATTPLTVAAMRHGATTVLDKPCCDTVLREAIQEAFAKGRKNQEKEAGAASAREKLAKLSENERLVLEMVLDGTPNKQIARRLGVCVRTVEARRSRIYQAMQVSSVAELVRQCVAAKFIDG